VLEYSELAIKSNILVSLSIYYSVTLIFASNAQTAKVLVLSKGIERY